MKRLLLALALLPAAASAIEFEAQPALSKVRHEGTVVIVDLPAGTFMVNEVPPAAAPVEQFEELPKKYRSKSTLALTLGEPMTVEDAQAVLDAWYRDTAIDYDSLRIRGLTLGERRYVVYCTSPSLFGCMDGKVLAGTVVTYEINGANRSGGMTGFQPRTVVIRRDTPSPAP